jgi:Zn-dependent protease with chaperone function
MPDDPTPWRSSPSGVGIDEDRSRYDRSVADVRAYPCPECGAACLGGGEFRRWCPTCNWNLDQGERDSGPEHLDLLDRAFVRLQRRNAARTFDEVVTASWQLDVQWRPGWTVANAGAVAIATGVHLVTLAVPATAVGLLVHRGVNGVTVTIAVVLVLFSLVLVPWRFDVLRRRRRIVLARATAPHLHDVVERVAVALDTRPPDVIRIDLDVNASVHRRRVRQRVLTIGAPLWFTLAPEQRIAMLGHEMAHLVDGDVLQTRYVWWAIVTLSRWRTFFLAGTRLQGIAALARPVAWGASTATHAVATAMVTAAFQGSQRGEYFADQLAARVASTRATVELLGTLRLAPVIRSAVHHSTSDDLRGLLANRLATVPSDERARLVLAARALTDPSTATTHPPVGLRIAALQAGLPRSSSLAVGPALVRAVDDELDAPSRELMHRARRTPWFG